MNSLLRSKWLRFAALCILGGLLFLGLSLWKPSAPASVSLLEPLPQDPHIQVYFNHAQSARYVDPFRGYERLGDNLEEVIIEAIAEAKSSVDVAIQELRLPAIAHALAQQQRAGIPVRVVLENSYSRPLSELTPAEVRQLDERQRNRYLEFVAIADRDQDGRISPTEAAETDPVIILRNAGVPVIDDTADGSKGSGLMHHKFVLIDQKRVVTGSTNFTLSEVHGDFLSTESRGNANHLVAIDSPEVAALFRQEFDILWGQEGDRVNTSKFGLQKPHRPPQTVRLTPTSTVTVQFSPTSATLPWEQSTNGLIARALGTAKQSVDLALFVFSEQGLSNALYTRHQQGVQIRALIDAGFIYRPYSEALDMMGLALADHQCRYAPDNAPWTKPIATVGIPQLAQGDVLHHKFAVVDNRLVILGSHNWSAAANRQNDENLLVIDNPTVAAHFRREFERLYSTATLGIPPWLQERVQERQAECGPPRR